MTETIERVIAEEFEKEFSGTMSGDRFAARVAARLEGGAWQPIETAPKDGTRILLWDDQDKEVCSAKWKGTGWRACGTEERIVWVKFTRWMPAPAPPQS